MSYYILIINLLNKELFLLWVPNCFPILGGKRHSKIPCRWRWNILLPTSVEITPDIFIEFTIIYIINNAFQVYMLQLNCYSNLLCSGCEEIARNYATGKGGHRPLTLLPSTTNLSVDTLNPLVPFPFLKFSAWMWHDGGELTDGFTFGWLFFALLPFGRPRFLFVGNGCCLSSFLLFDRGNSANTNIQ